MRTLDLLRLAAGTVAHSRWPWRRRWWRPDSACCNPSCLHDRSAVLPLAADDLNAGAMLLHSPLATAYGELFELMWSDARTPDGAPGESGLSSRETKVIGLLLDGATDHQIAARLGMSSRTVRAVVAQLQQRYGTRSRMALGFQLARATD